MFPLNIIIDILKYYNLKECTTTIQNISQKYEYICTTEIKKSLYISPIIYDNLCLYKNLRCISLICISIEKIYIPDTLINLRKITISVNGLTELHIPNTLINLRTITCMFNKLTKLHIPDTLTNLQSIGCCFADITELYIPDTLLKLQSIYCDKSVSVLTNLKISIIHSI